MRKHLLRFLLIVMIVCFGVGIMAACGDDTEGENPNPDEAATYTLTYKANGGVGADKTEQHKEGDTVTVLGANTFTYDGHTFTKWKEEGGSAEYNAGATFTMPGRNVTLAAQWQANGSSETEYEIKVTDPTGKAHVEFDKEPPYHTGDVVKFTVDFAPGENLRVVSVKADGVELQKGEDGKYTVTVAEKDVGITIESEPMGEHEFNVSLSVTGGGNGNSATLDKEGVVGKDEKVTLTVVTADGYTAEVKLNGSKIDLTAEGKYELTVTENAAFTVVFTKNSTETQEYTVSLNVTGVGNGNSAELDKTGKVAKDTKVTLTVVTAAGYSVEVKLNGNHVDLNGQGKYELTVTQDAAFTVVFTRNGENPPAKNLTAFHNANAISDNNDSSFQIALRAEATGYASAEEMQSDLKLLVGTAEFEAVHVDAPAGDSAIYVIFFRLTKDGLAGMGASEDVTLKSAAADKTYPVPAVRVDDNSSVTLGTDVYTLAYEGEKLVLKHTAGEPAPADEIDGVWTVESDEGTVTLYIKKVADGIDVAEIIGSGDEAIGTSIHIPEKSDNTYGFETPDGSTTVTVVDGTLTFTVTVQGQAHPMTSTSKAELPAGIALPNGVYENAEKTVKLTLGANSSLVRNGETKTVTTAVVGDYICLYTEDSSEHGISGVKTGSLAKQEADGTLTLYVGEDKYTLTKQTSAQEEEFGDTNLIADGDGFAIFFRVKGIGYADADALKAGVKLTIGSTQFDAAEVTGWADALKTVKFSITKAQALALGEGDLAVSLSVGGKSYGMPCTVVSGAENSTNLENKSFLLNVKDEKLYLTVSASSGPVDQAVTAFGDVSLVPYGDGIAIVVRLVQTTGLADDNAIQNTLKLKVGDDLTLDVVKVDSNAPKIVYFSMTKEQALALTGDVAVVLKCGNNSYEKPYSVLSGGQFKVDLEGKTFTLTEKEGKLYLVVTGSVTPDPTEYTVNVQIDSSKGSYELTPSAEGNKYSSGAEVKLTVTVNPGSVLDQVRIGDTVLTADAEGKYTIPLEGKEETITVIVVLRGENEIVYGEENKSVGSWKYWNDANSTIEEVVFTDEDNDGVNIHAKLSATGALAWGFQLFYNPEDYAGKLNKKYTVTFTINVAEACKITANGKGYDLTAGDNEISVDFTYTYNGDPGGMSFFDMQLVLEAGKSYELTIKNILWNEAVASGDSIAEGGEPVSIVEKDWRVWHDQGWCGSTTELTEAKFLNPEKTSVHILLNCTSGTCDFGLQLFYNNETEYTKGKTYKLTVTIYAAEACELKVNNDVTVYTFTKGETKTITVTFVYESAKINDNEASGVSLFDMQVKVEAGKTYDLTLSEIKWEEVGEAEPEKPTFTFVKGEGAEGEDPRLEAEDPNDRGSYTVNLPQNPYTAPEGKYFRGWQINDTVYFPEEAYDAEAGAEITITAVWEDLYAEFNADQSVIGVWGSSAGAELKIVEGKTTKAVVTYSALDADGDGSTAYAGLNIQIIKSSTQFYFLRTDVEGALITSNNWGTGWRDASIVPHKKGEETTLWGIGSYTDKDGTTITTEAWLAAKLAGRTEIEITLSDGVLTVTETYYTDKTGDTVYLAFVYTISDMTEHVYSANFAAQQGTTVDTATVTSNVLLSDQQSTSVEEPLTWNASKAYVNNIWHTEIRKGEKLELNGTVKFDRVSDQGAFAPAVWDGPVLSLYTNAPLERMRVDNYVLDGTGSAAAGWDTTNGLHCVNAQSGTGSYSQYVENQEYNFKVTLDWTGDSIVYTIAIGDNLVVSTWTVTATGGALQDSYFACFGGDNAVMTFTSMTRSHAAQA